MKRQILRDMRTVSPLFVIVMILALFVAALAEETDPATGLVIAPGFETVKTNCTVCHSAKIITQNRMDRDGWEETIRWMQKTQGLREFDQETEKEILDYLSANYSPKPVFRRPPLQVDWE